MTIATSITIRMPFAVRWRPARKTVGMPEGGLATAPSRAPADPALVKALAWAHLWKRLLDEGRYALVSEVAAAEKLDLGYLGRILQLALLAPDIVEAILDGPQPDGMTVPALMEGVPAKWKGQRIAFRVAADRRPTKAESRIVGGV